MAKDPAFLFYSSDFLTGTMTMSMQERGQYITLLATMHQTGRLNKEEIKVVLRGKKVSDIVLRKFKSDEEGRFYNERLENEITKRKQFTESRRNSLNISNGDQVNVYLLFDEDSGNYKIGSSKYPLLRLEEIKKKRPNVILYWKTETLVDRENEKKLHEEFKDKRIKQDWFSLTVRDLENIQNRFRTEDRTEDEIVIENENIKEDKGSMRGEGEVGLSREGFFSDTLDKALVLTDTEIGATVEYLRLLTKKILTISEVVNCWEAFKIKQFALHEWYNNHEKLLGHFRDSLKHQIVNGTYQQTPSEGNTRQPKQGTSTARTGALKGWTIGGGANSPV